MSKPWLLHRHVSTQWLLSGHMSAQYVLCRHNYVCSVCTGRTVLLVPLILFAIVNVLVDTSAQIKVTKGPERGQIELSKLLAQHFCCSNTYMFIGPATRCDVAHLRWGVPKPLRCTENACDALRCKFQHVGNFAPDIGISQLFLVQFSSGFHHNDWHLESLRLYVNQYS